MNSSPPSIGLVVGNPKLNSRTLHIAQSIRDVVRSYAEAEEAMTVDLAQYVTEVFDQTSPVLAHLCEEVASLDFLVVASPTYKATYTGLLKAFFDRYGNNALRRVIAIPVMVGASPLHAMAPEFSLRPLLIELGATVPSRSLFVLESQIDQFDDVVAEWAATALPLVMAAFVGRERGNRPTAAD